MHSNFCAHCGARLMRKGWRSWLRGAICDDCATRPSVSTRGRTLIVIGLFAVGAFAFGRYLRPPPPPLIIQRAANSPLSDAPLNVNGISRKAGDENSVATAASVNDDDSVYMCGARTKKGTPCRRRVQLAGERCYQHKGRAAMVPPDKLVIKHEVKK